MRSVFHHVPWLWRLHRVHRADLDIDVTTGVRFHPVEIALSILIKIAAVAACRPLPSSPSRCCSMQPRCSTTVVQPQ